MRKIVRPRWQRHFIEAGTYHLTGWDVSEAGKCLPLAHQDIYAVLETLARKATIQELQILTVAFRDKTHNERTAKLSAECGKRIVTGND